VTLDDASLMALAPKLLASIVAALWPAAEAAQIMADFIGECPDTLGQGTDALTIWHDRLCGSSIREAVSLVRRAVSQVSERGLEAPCPSATMASDKAL
jgi:hypothetical protein